MVDLNELLEKVRNATGPDRLLDALIYEACGYERNPKGSGEYVRERGEDCYWQSRPVTADIGAAIELLEKALPGWQWLIRNSETGDFLANIHEANKCPNEGHECFPEWHETPALALSAALLTALIAKESAK